MARLNHAQWATLHNLSLEVHLARTEQELIDFVLYRVPEALGISYTVWHERSKTAAFSPERAHLTEVHRDEMFSRLDIFNETIPSHPVVVGLEMTDEIILPEDRVLSMNDFVSMRQVRETAIHREFYRHVEIGDHAAIEFWHDNENGVMICFNAPEGHSDENKLMIHLLRQHLSVAFRRFKVVEEKTKALTLVLPSLDLDTLTRRESETLPHLLNGKSNSEIALILGISSRTAEKHVASIIEKSGAENRKVLISEARYLAG